MPIEVFLIGSILTGILTSLAHSWVHGIRQEYRNHQERKRLRIGLAKRLSEHHGVPYEEIRFGKHRLAGSSAAHELCTDDHPCAHRGWQNGMVHAEFYIERARLERLAKEQARREAEEWQDIPWPRAEDIPSLRAEEAWESDRFSGLLCGYRTPSSFPELSTPVGSNVASNLDFIAERTESSTTREPIFVGRQIA